MYKTPVSNMNGFVKNLKFFLTAKKFANACICFFIATNFKILTILMFSCGNKKIFLLILFLVNILFFL